METLRLRRIQEPSRVERLLEAYVSRSVTLPPQAYQIRDSRQLPPSLRSVIARAAKQGETCCCWAHGSNLWLFVCEMSLPLSRERGAPVIVVQQYNEDGDVTDSGSWRFDATGGWTRCQD